MRTIAIQHSVTQRPGNVASPKNIRAASVREKITVRRKFRPRLERQQGPRGLHPRHLGMHSLVDAILSLEFFQHIRPAEADSFADLDERQTPFFHPRINRALGNAQFYRKFGLI